MKTFYEEMEVMIRFTHSNIVSLLGMYMIIPICFHSSVAQGGHFYYMHVYSNGLNVYIYVELSTVHVQVIMSLRTKPFIMTSLYIMFILLLNSIEY